MKDNLVATRSPSEKKKKKNTIRWPLDFQAKKKKNK
jgi:hypothetical protein